MAAEPENEVVAPIASGRAGGRPGVTLGEPATAGFGLPSLSEVADQLAGLVEVLHVLMVSP
jgi:hypothetical protein